MQHSCDVIPPQCFSVMNVLSEGLLDESLQLCGQQAALLLVLDAPLQVNPATEKRLDSDFTGALRRTLQMHTTFRPFRMLELTVDAECRFAWCEASQVSSYEHKKVSEFTLSHVGLQRC